MRKVIQMSQRQISGNGEEKSMRVPGIDQPVKPIKNDYEKIIVTAVQAAIAGTAG